MYRFVKRLLDILFAALAGAVLLLPLIIMSLVIQLDSPGPVLFTQKRVGKNKRYFQIYKFRTMRTDTPHEIPTHMLNSPDAYITRVGRFLRKTSLDELPQLYNIFVGDMSFVGPRPALWNQFDLIAERDKYSGRWGLTPNTVRPGLTGWAQVNGRDELPIAEKARRDGEYVERYGFVMDWRCFVATIFHVARQDGIVEGDSNGKADGAA